MQAFLPLTPPPHLVPLDADRRCAHLPTLPHAKPTSAPCPCSGQEHRTSWGRASYPDFFFLFFPAGVGSFPPCASGHQDFTEPQNGWGWEGPSGSHLVQLQQRHLQQVTPENVQRASKGPFSCVYWTYMLNLKELSETCKSYHWKWAPVALERENALSFRVF